MGRSSRWINCWCYHLLRHKKTIESSENSIQQTLVEQRRIREEELLIQTSKERLLNLYHPVDALIAEFTHQYGAHNFSDLTKEQKHSFLTLVTNNIVYGDHVFYHKFVELKWESRTEGNEAKRLANERYNELLDLMTDEIINLQEIIKLPVLYQFPEDMEE